MTESITQIAGQVSQVDEAILKALPFVSTFIGFIPGAAVAVPFLPLVTEVLTALDNAAKAVAAGNTGAGVQVVLQEIMNHLTPGAPNAAALAPTAAK